VEIGAEVLLMGKNRVDGIYDADPRHHPQAKRFQRLSYLEALNLQLQVMDSTALSLCMENHLPIIVFDLQARGSLLQAARGETIGTLVSDHPVS
jgi:uridylate kinase